jgi:hypothetical protein
MQGGTTAGAEAAQNTAASSSPNIAGAIAGVLLPSGSGNNGGSGSSQGANGGTNVGSATGIAIVPLPDSGSSTPSPLVLTLGGKATTIVPTVISGSQGSVTAFILAPGSTLLAGGSALTLSDTTISLPVASKTGSATASGKGSNSASSTSTSTAGIGGAIASGLGYTVAVTTGLAGRTSSHDSLFLAAALISGSIGWLAIWL